jgi:biotin carboxyl carrier protein
MTALLTRPPLAPPTSADAPASSLAGTLVDGLAVVVAPSTGRFRPAAAPSSGEGDLLGHVTGGKGRADEVRAPVDGTVDRFLVRPGQLVTRGQGLVCVLRSRA